MELSQYVHPKISSIALSLVFVLIVVLLVIPTSLALQAYPKQYSNILSGGNTDVFDMDNDGIPNYMDVYPYRGMDEKRDFIESIMRLHGAGYDSMELLTGLHIVTLSTEFGDIVLELDADEAPFAVTNFIGLAKKGFYEHALFNRVIDNFIVQGTSSTEKSYSQTSYFGMSFPDELNDFFMERGIVAMANRGPNTNSNQFFILQKPEGAQWLKDKHTIFGVVKEGMDIVDAIVTVPTGTFHVPLQPIFFSVQLYE